MSSHTRLRTNNTKTNAHTCKTTITLGNRSRNLTTSNDRMKKWVGLTAPPLPPPVRSAGFLFGNVLFDSLIGFIGRSPGKIRSELSILLQSSNQNPNQSSNNTGLVPMEIDWFEKGKNTRNAKGKSKGKDTSRGKGKNKSDKGKGKSNKGSTRTATVMDQCRHCGKYGHIKCDGWKLHGRSDQKNVNRVESNASNNTASSPRNCSTTSGAASSSGASSSVRLFAGLHQAPGPVMGDSDEDVEVRDLRTYDSFEFRLVHATCFHKFFQVVQLNGFWTTLQRPTLFTQRVAAILTFLILTMMAFGHVLMPTVDSLIGFWQTAKGKT